MNTKLLMVIILGFLGWSPTSLQASGDELVVHEGGTFTSISGADSQILEWTPYRGGAELPGFVYGGKYNARGTVRMETQVICFSTPKRLPCNVRVSLPQGEIREYYPMPEIPGYPVKVVQWKDVELLPGRTVNFPVEQGMNHYYHARATEAVPLCPLHWEIGVGCGSIRFGPCGSERKSLLEYPSSQAVARSLCLHESGLTGAFQMSQHAR